VEKDISATEAQQLIKTEPRKANNDLKNGEDYQLCENDRQSTDPFSSYFYSHQVKLNDLHFKYVSYFRFNFFLNSNLVSSKLRDQTSKIILNRDALLQLKPTEVIVCRWPSPLPSQYYRNFLPDVRCSSIVNIAIKYSALMTRSCIIYRKSMSVLPFDSFLPYILISLGSSPLLLHFLSQDTVLIIVPV
jgi:hypothetical protein